MGILPDGFEPFRGFVFLIIGAIFYIGPSLVQANSIGTAGGYHPATLFLTIGGVLVSVCGMGWYLLGQPLYRRKKQAQ
jgi:hypothetical protein